jgi:hypothetical protein
MSAAEMTEQAVAFVGYPQKVVFVKTVTTGDWITLADPGAVGISFNIATGQIYGNSAQTALYATMVATAASSTTSSITYSTVSDASMLASGGFYIRIADEIVYVKSGGAATSGTLECIRGCLGTTAATHTGATGYILNCIVLTTGTVGQHVITYVPLPNDPKAGTMIGG